MPRNEIGLVHSSTRSLLPSSRQGEALSSPRNCPSPGVPGSDTLPWSHRYNPSLEGSRWQAPSPKWSMQKVTTTQTGSRQGYRLRACLAGIWQRAVPPSWSRPKKGWVSQMCVREASGMKFSHIP